MPYRSDYILRLIEQLGMVIRRALERAGAKDAGEPYDVAGQAIGLALGMDATIATMLSPRSLASLLELAELDPEALDLVAQAIELKAEMLEAGGEDGAARFRRAQATAVRGKAG